MRIVYFYSLVILLALLSLAALFGGGSMILDPTGETLNMPLTMLDHSVFRSFRVPGILLFLIFGIIPLLLIRPLFKKPFSRFLNGLNILVDMHWAWTFVIYICFGLIIWIQVQITVLQEVHWLHDLYTYYAIFMLALALMPGVRERFKKV